MTKFTHGGIQLKLLVAKWSPLLKNDMLLCFFSIYLSYIDFFLEYTLLFAILVAIISLLLEDDIEHYGLLRKSKWQIKKGSGHSWNSNHL